MFCDEWVLHQLKMATFRRPSIFTNLLYLQVCIAVIFGVGLGIKGAGKASEFFAGYVNNLELYKCVCLCEVFV